MDQRNPTGHRNRSNRRNLRPLFCPGHGGAEILLALVAALWGVPAFAVLVRWRGWRRWRAGGIAAGDLSDADQRAPTGSLLAHVETMRQSLRQMVALIQSKATDLQTASASLSGATHDIGASAASQSQSSQSMAQSMDKLSGSIGQISERASGMIDLSSAFGQQTSASLQDRRPARRSGQGVRHRQPIVARGGRAGRHVGANRLDGQHHRRHRRADQSLALNAAIEAARAGESGRALPWWPTKCANWPSTSGSTLEIQRMIQDITRHTREATTLMESQISQVQTGIELAGQARQVVGEIAENHWIRWNRSSTSPTPCKSNRKPASMCATKSSMSPAKTRTPTSHRPRRQGRRPAARAGQRYARRGVAVPAVSAK